MSPWLPSNDYLRLSPWLGASNVSILCLINLVSADIDCWWNSRYGLRCPVICKTYHILLFYSPKLLHLWHCWLEFEDKEFLGGRQVLKRPDLTPSAVVKEPMIITLDHSET